LGRRDRGWIVKNWSDLYDNYADNRIQLILKWWGLTRFKRSVGRKGTNHRDLTGKV
jgi:hypothetical protein